MENVSCKIINSCINYYLAIFIFYFVNLVTFRVLKSWPTPSWCFKGQRTHHAIPVVYGINAIFATDWGSIFGNSCFYLRTQTKQKRSFFLWRLHAWFTFWVLYTVACPQGHLSQSDKLQQLLWWSSRMTPLWWCNNEPSPPDRF